MRTRRARVVLAAAALGSLAQVSFAASSSFTFSGNSSWTITSNWLGGLPGGNSDVFFINGGSAFTTLTETFDSPFAGLTYNSLTLNNTFHTQYLFSQTANTLNVNAATLGTSGSGFISLGGGTENFVNSIDLGAQATAFGIATISAGVMNVGTNTIGGGSLTVGDHGAGSVNLSGTGVINDYGVVYVGSTGSGVFNQSGGTHNIGSAGGDGILYLGNTISGSGTYNLSAGTLSVIGGEDIGNDAAASAFIQSGGTNTISSDVANAFILSSGGGAATYSLSNSAQFTDARNETIGYVGNGTFLQSSGTNTNGGEIWLGQSASGAGTYILSGGTVTTTGVSVGGSSLFGSGGRGVFTVNSTADLKVSGTLKVYNAAGNALNLNGGTISAGTLDLSGNPSLFNWSSGTLILSQSVYFGDPATNALGNTLTLGSNRALIVNDTSNGLTLGGNGNATVTVNGGTLVAAGNLFLGNTGNGTLILQSGLVNAGQAINAGMTVGYYSAGTVLQSGGTLNVYGGLAIPKGSFQLSGTGALNILNQTYNDEAVGEGFGSLTSGTFLQSGGTNIVSGNLDIGADQGVGTFTLTGGAASIAFDAYVGGNKNGPNGTGTLNITGGSINIGGTLKVYSSGTVNLGGGTLAVGSIDLSGNPSGLNWNNGTLQFLSGLTIASPSTFGSSPTLSAARTLVVSGGSFTNNSQLYLAGGQLSIIGLNGASNNGLISGFGTVDTGANVLNNSGVIAMNGLSLAGSIQMNNLSTGIITGNGTIAIPIGNNGLIEVDSQILNVTSTIINNNILQLGGSAAELIGTLINNNSTGIIQGQGIVNSQISNLGIIKPIGGTLNLPGQITNSGQIIVPQNATLMLTYPGGAGPGGGSVVIGGQIDLQGGEFDTSAATFDSSGVISGRGTIHANQFFNTGTMQFSAGFTDVFAPVVNDGKITITGGSTTTFYNTLNNSGGSISINTNSTGVFMGVVNGTANFSGPGVKDFEASGNTLNALNTIVGSTLVGPQATVSTDLIHENNLTLYGQATLTAGATPNTPSKTSTVNSLSIQPGGKFDLTNNSLIIDYSGTVGTLVNDTRLELKSGQLFSSQADLHHVLGYADNEVLNKATFSGQPVDTTSILIKYTFNGDANLDGKVDVTDLGDLASNWQKSGSWVQGDFNYDGTVNVTDLGILASDWQQGVGNPLGPDSFQQALASVGLTNVPEPAAIASLLFLTTWPLKRPRR